MFKRLENPAETRVNIIINGQPAQAQRNDTVAAALLAHGATRTRSTPVTGAARAPFCLMGVCFDCLVVIDGKANQRACMQRVREGINIEYQVGAGPAL